LDKQHWLMHNARFDMAVFNRVQPKLGLDIAPAKVSCTADMSAYLCGVRDLQGACQVLLGIKPDKSYRIVADGKHGWDFTPEEWEHITKSGIADAVNCLKLWQDCSTNWPEFEQELSRITREGCMYGVYIDTETLAGYVELCSEKMKEYEDMMPWVKEWKGSKYKTPTAKGFIKRQCEKDGVPLPLTPDGKMTMDKKSPVSHEWCDKYENDYPWIMAIRVWAELKRLRDVFNNELEMVGPDSVMPFQLLYYGAATGRWSGGGME
jgi:hypothetical protein